MAKMTVKKPKGLRDYTYESKPVMTRAPQKTQMNSKAYKKSGLR